MRTTSTFNTKKNLTISWYVHHTESILVCGDMIVNPLTLKYGL